MFVLSPLSGLLIGFGCLSVVSLYDRSFPEKIHISIVFRILRGILKTSFTVLVRKELFEFQIQFLMLWWGLLLNFYFLIELLAETIFFFFLFSFYLFRY